MPHILICSKIKSFFFIWFMCLVLLFMYLFYGFFLFQAINLDKFVNMSQFCRKLCSQSCGQKLCWKFWIACLNLFVAPIFSLVFAKNFIEWPFCWNKLIWFSFKFLIFMKCFVRCKLILSHSFLHSCSLKNFMSWTWKLWRQRDCQGTWK